MTQPRPKSGSERQKAHRDNSLLIDWISRRTGLSFRSQRETASDIINEFMRRSGIDTSQACRQRLESDQAAFDDLIGELTIGETYFYRDEKQFDLIAGEFLQVMRQLRPADHRLRLWSAGCASGEEAWTLASLLSESGLTRRAHILGTDISRESLTRARAGEYGVWSLRGSAGERMRPWGQRSGRTFIVSERLRSMVTFEYLNLAADKYPSFASKTNGLDLILCRNVLIYFNRETIKTVAERMFQCLAPGGWLITGASDPSLADYAPFEVLMRDCGQVYVRPDSLHRREPLRPKQSHIPKSPNHQWKPVSTNTSSQAGSRPKDNPPTNVPEASVRNADEASVVAAAKHALQSGDYAQVLELTDNKISDAQCSVLRVRALANIDTEKAEAFCRKAAAQHKVSVELHYLHSILLTELDRYADAAVAARNAVFLDQKLIVGHLALGSALEHLGEIDHARRSFRNAGTLSESWPSNQPIPCSDGESAARLAESAARRLSLLESRDQQTNS